MGTQIGTNLTLEFTSAGASDGRLYVDSRWPFSFSDAGVVIQQSSQVLTDFKTASQSSVLVAVPGLVSFGGAPYDVPFTGSGPASGTVLTTRFVTPTGSVATETITRV